MAVGGAFLAALVFFGGASRADALTQPFIRIASLFALAVLGWRFTNASWRLVRVPTLFLVAFAVLCLVQLLPLPPTLWRSLPGHAQFAQLLLSNGFEIGWRPWTMTPDNTLNALFATLPGFATLLILASLSPQQFASVPIALCGVIGLCTLLGLLQIYGGGPYPYAITNFGTPVGFFANRNHAALLLAMTFPAGGVWLSVAMRQRGRIAASYLGLFGLGSASAMALLLVNGSRNGLIAAAIGFAGAVAMLLREPMERQGRRILLLASGAIAIVLALTAAAFVVSARDLALERLFHPQIGAEMRVEALPTLFLLARTYFPFGSGLGSFDPVFRVAEPNSMVSNVYFNHAHNDWLELLIETGIVGPVLILVFAAWAGVRSWRAWASSSSSELVGRFGSILLLQLGVASAFDYPVRTPFMLAMLAFAAACITRPIEKPSLAVRGSGSSR